MKQLLDTRNLPKTENPPVYSSALFTYHKGTETMSADASTLGWDGERDVVVKSTKTGKQVTFSLAAQDSHGGDVLGWEFWPNQLVAVNLYIYND